MSPTLAQADNWWWLNRANDQWWPKKSTDLEWKISERINPANDVAFILSATSNPQKILSQASNEVRSTYGYFIYQEGGIFHKIGPKTFLLKWEFFDLVYLYLQATNNQVTVEAKRTFESQDMQAIQELVSRVRRTSTIRSK